MSCYENLVMKTQMNYSRHYSTYASGGTAAVSYTHLDVYKRQALDREMDQVMGYEAGADDYITKPFSLSVLLLKIEAHFRRRQEKTEAGKMISGNIVFIAGEMKVLIKNREISLTKTELKMLTFFLQNPKQILSKTQILENVFDLEGDFVDENTIAVNILSLIHI